MTDAGISVLGLRSSARVDVVRAGRFGRRRREVEVTAYAWTVDGVDLGGWVGERRCRLDPVAPREETGWLAGDDGDANERLDRLSGRLPADFDDDRVALMTCSECGDLGCGAFTAQLRWSAATVVWRALAWYSPHAEDPVDSFSASLDLTFDRAAYLATLETARARLGPVVPRPMKFRIQQLDRRGGGRAEFVFSTQYAPDDPWLTRTLRSAALERELVRLGFDDHRDTNETYAQVRAATRQFGLGQGFMEYDQTRYGRRGPVQHEGDLRSAT